MEIKIGHVQIYGKATLISSHIIYLFFLVVLLIFVYLDIAHKLKDYLFIWHHNVFILNLVLILLALKVQGDRCGGQSRFWMTNLIDRCKNRARTKQPDDPCLTVFCSGYRTRSKVRDFRLKRLKNYTHGRQKTFTQKVHYEDSQLKSSSIQKQWNVVALIRKMSN